MRHQSIAALSLLSVAACARSTGPSPTAPAAAAAAPRPATASADATSIAYAPGSTRYRVETQQSTTQEMMGQTNTIDATTTQLVSVTLTPQGDSLAVRATLDSMNLNFTGPMPGGAEAAEAARQLTGKSVSGTMTRSGRLGTLTSSDTASAMQQLVNGLREFFLIVPGAPLTAGREWTDTVSNTQNMGPFNIQSQSIRTHRIAGWETRDGVRALRVSTTSSYTLTGSGETQGTPLEISGGGRATSERYISAAGVYLGATEADSSDMTVNLVSMGMSVPVRRTERSTVTRLP